MMSIKRNQYTHLFWNVIKGTFVFFVILLIIHALNSLGILLKIIGYNDWLPNTQYGFDQLIRYFGFIGLIGCLLDLLLLFVRWVRYLLQRPFFY
jgi:hypothetical protein